MSGKINMTGSKSGIIGTTELEYEEGEWTPTWTPEGGSVVVSSNRTARYIRIGKMLYWDYKQYINSVSSPTGRVTIGGLPYSGRTDVHSVFNNIRTDALSSSLQGYPSAYLNAATSFMIIDWVPGTSENAGDWANHMDTDCWFRMSGVYMIAD